METTEPFFRVLTFFALAAIMAPSTKAAGVTIDDDTTIDSGSSISGSSIEVIDGVGGSTSVNIVTGGSVREFNARENSEILLDGGAVTYLSLLENNTTLTLKSGQIGCTESICEVIDYDALLHVADNSSIHVYGGTIDGVISLDDVSTAHFYGRGLTLSIDGNGILVQGEFANGGNGFFRINNAPLQNTSRRVFLHAIPEPSAVALAVSLGFCMILRPCLWHRTR